MRNRSLFGLFVLLFGASCVPSPDGARIASRPGTSRSGPAPAQPATRSSAHGSRAAAIAAPFAAAVQGDEDARRSLDCLTAAVYYEARSEPVDGQRAVAQVVLNRVRHPGFPNSVCGVVYQRKGSGTGCQFSFACDGSLARRREPSAWERSRRIAEAALGGDVDASVGLATHYHTTAVLPWWARSLNRIATIGSQIFYGWGGRMGNALAFRQNYSGVEPREDGDAGGASAANPATVRYALAGGASVTVHRGGGDAAPAQAGSTPAVRVHVASSGPRLAAETAATPEVRIHRGTVPENVDPV